MDDSERLSTSRIHHIAWAVGDGTARPDEAAQLLREFVACVNAHEPLPERLREHFRDAFLRYLSGSCGIEAALGMVRGSKGHPGADEKRNQMIAAAVLKRRLAGDSLNTAAAAASEEFHLGETQVRKAWADHKYGALTLLLMSRPPDKYPWSPEEVRRLTKILGKERWFTAPGKSPNFPE